MCPSVQQGFRRFKGVPKEHPAGARLPQNAEHLTPEGMFTRSSLQLLERPAQSHPEGRSRKDYPPEEKGIEA